MSLSIQGQFICPILHTTMTDPVFAQDGHTYERSAIEFWFKEHDTSPLTGKKIDKSLLNNYAMRSQIAEAGLFLKPLETFKTELIWSEDAIVSLTVFPNGKYILTGHNTKVRIWDLETRKIVKKLKGHTSYVLSIAVFLNGKYVLTGSADRTVRLWNLETEVNGGTVRVLWAHTDGVTSVAVSPDGNYVVTGSWDKTARVWALGNGDVLRVLKGHTGGVRAVALFLDGKYVVTGSNDCTARVWDLETGETVRVLKGHAFAVTAVAVSPDGKCVVTGSYDGTARVWNLETAGSEGSEGNGEAARVLEGHTSYVRAVAVSPNGKYVVTGSEDKTARVWNLETAEAVRVLEGHTSYVNAVAVLPDGKYVVTGSLDGTARVWNLET